MQKFKKGDRVKVLSSDYSKGLFVIGGIYRVINVGAHWVEIVPNGNEYPEGLAFLKSQVKLSLIHLFEEDV